MEPASLFHQNYEEDFLYAFRFSEDVPACPWRLIFNTYVGHQRSLASFAASFDGETHVNCDVVEGSPDTILVRFKNHRLPPGVLHYRLLRRVENDLFDDGEQKLVLPQPMPVELWEGPTDSAQPVTTIVLEPMLRGDSAYRIYKKHHPESTLTEAEYGEVPVAAAAKADTAAGKANKAVEAVMQLPVVRTDMEQTLDAAGRERARRNISVVGALPVALTIGADNALTVATDLAILTAHYRLYAARPGAYRWSVVISDASGAQVEEAEAEMISAEGVLYLAFRSAVLGQRYDLALTLTADAVTAASVAPWLRNRQEGVQTSEGQFITNGSGLNKYNGDRGLEAFFKTGSDITTRQYVVLNQPLGLAVESGRIYVNMWGVYGPGYTIAPDAEYHVVVVFDKAKLEASLYVNDKFALSQVRSDVPPAYSTYNNIGGGGSNGLLFKGLVYHTRLFGYAPSLADIALFYNNGNPAGYVLPAAEKRAGRCIAEYLPGNIVPARREDYLKVVFPTSSYTGSRGVFAPNNNADATVHNDQPAANGFSGDYTRFEAVRNVSLYCGYWNNYLRKEAPLRITLEYRSNVPIYQSTDHRIKLGDANEGTPKIVSFDIMGGAYPSGFGNSDTNPDAWLEIRVLSIDVAEGVGLKWYDSAKQLPVNGKLPPLWGPAGGYDLAANGFPRIACKGEPENAAEIAEVLAQSESSLAARIARLEQALVSLTSGQTYVPKLTVRELEVWGANNLILTGEGAPTKAPDRAGQIYIDTQNNAAYRSTGNAAVSDWKNA